MSTVLSRYAARIVGLLVLVEAVSVVIVWAISAVGQTEEGIFALFLAVDLVSLAMISNVYRSYKHGLGLDRRFLLAGCALILIFVYVSLAL
jgi:hypothetical protein